MSVSQSLKYRYTSVLIFLLPPPTVWGKSLLSSLLLTKNSLFKDIVQIEVDPLPLTLILTNLFLTKGATRPISNVIGSNVRFFIHSFYFRQLFSFVSRIIVDWYFVITTEHEISDIIWYQFTIIIMFLLKFNDN